MFQCDANAVGTLRQMQQSQFQSHESEGDAIPELELDPNEESQAFIATGNNRDDSTTITDATNKATTASTYTSMVSFRNDMEEMDVMQSVHFSDIVLRDYVRTKVFPLKKFITTEEEMAFNGKLCKLIMRGMKVRNHSSVMWWTTHKDIVRKTINQKRAAVSSSIKRCFIRKYTFILLMRIYCLLIYFYSSTFVSL